MKCVTSLWLSGVYIMPLSLASFLKIQNLFSVQFNVTCFLSLQGSSVSYFSLSWQYVLTQISQSVLLAKAIPEEVKKVCEKQIIVDTQGLGPNLATFCYYRTSGDFDILLCLWLACDVGITLPKPMGLLKNMLKVVQVLSKKYTLKKHP